MADKRWLTIAQIAHRLDVPPEVVRRWLREGRLVGTNFGGKTGYRIRPDDLDRFLREDPYLPKHLRPSRP